MIGRLAIALCADVKHPVQMLPGFLVLLSLQGTSGQAQPDSTRATPAGKWVLDYADEYCVLSRDGAAGVPGIAFRTRPVALQHDVLIYLPRANVQRSTNKGRVAAGEGELGPLRFVEEAEPKDKRFRFINTVVSNEEFEAISKAGSVRVTVENKFDLRVPIPQIGKAFAALRDCENDLARRWGIDPMDLRSWKVPPRPKLEWNKVRGNWPDWSRDFGTNKASYTVDETGQVVACSIIVSSGSRKMDKALCDGLRRMPFKPALDSEGRPVRSAQIFGTYWRLIWERRYEFGLR